MKKSNIRLLVVLIAMLVLAVVLLFTKYEVRRDIVNGEKKFRITQKSTTLKALRDFAVADTASVDKIFIADKSNNTILLERKENYWTVNNTFGARQDLVDILLETVHRIEVTSPVPKSRQEYVVRDLAANGVKCEIYQGNKRIKTFYVGGVTQNNLGTYMLLENSSEPFEVSIAGFNGFLNTRFVTSLKEWRTRLVYRYTYDQIASVEVDFPENQEESYRMENKGDNQFDLISLKENKSVGEFDTILVKQQLGRFKKVGYEFLVEDEHLQEKFDSISATTPMFRFVVENQNGERKELKCYSRPNIIELKNDDGEVLNHDIERHYGIFDESLVVMQYYTTDNLSLRLSEMME